MHDRERRKGKTGDTGLILETEGSKPHISQNIKAGKSANVNPAMEVMAKDTINIPLNIHTTPTVNARVALVINMDLVCGPDGHWDIFFF